MQNEFFEKFKVGDESTLTKTFTQVEVIEFSKMSKDENPIHFDAIYASNSRFKKPIVQGPFVASLIGGILGTRLPGPGTVYINQNTNFIKPVFVDDTVTAYVRITSIRQDKPIIKLKTWVNRNDELVIDGEATVLFLV